ncbi:hypothetical protein PHMEG_00038828 [Phytophthora megakarya]|uniref:RRM domain-containing protein n=1 Tax=Phytophthora megakarya TaxID=4795 RepID=A0A225UGT0_9STRA|nr:hypothetical protein PHMEG_00038828 [Phytophthora megakarya]
MQKYRLIWTLVVAEAVEDIVVAIVEAIAEETLVEAGTSREELSFLFQYLNYETVRITARGFGFVTLRSAEDMNRAVEDLDGKEFNGMKLRVSCALPPK